VIIRARQQVWTTAVQKRVATTSSMLSSVKSLKIMGLSTTIQESIQCQRVQEIELAKKFRYMVVLLNTIGSLNDLLNSIILGIL
jgi:ATP-binding cassette subfamily C (CFTR/MRP) protein 1